MPSRRLRSLIALVMAAILLTGCDLPWSFNRLAGSQPSRQSEVYVASFIIRNLVEQDGLVLAVEPQASTFYEGQVVLFVLNKWSGLPLGDHHEAAVVQTLAGKELAREEADFTIGEGDLTATLLEPFQLDNLAPGRYWVVIELDGREQVRYQFLVIAVQG